MKVSEELLRAWRRFEEGSEPATVCLKSSKADGYYFEAMDVEPTDARYNGEAYRRLSHARFRIAVSMAMSDEAGR